MTIIYCIARTAANLKREKTKVVTFRVPHNAAVQIYDHKEKIVCVVFGPELVMLRPNEQFTQLSLSGGKPETKCYKSCLSPAGTGFLH